jgi:hypothetical protein
MDAVGYAGRLQLWHDVHRLLVGKIMTGFNSKRKMAQDKAMSRPIEADYTSQVAYTRALEAYCDSLAQPVQEPVAWGFKNDVGAIYDCISPEAHADAEGEYTVPLYTTPPQRLWVGLTDEEISATSKGHIVRSTYARAIEQALKEKNT